MGLVNIKRRSQTRISKCSTFDRGFRNKSQCQKSSFIIRRGRKFIIKRSNRTGSSIRETKRFLQYTVSCSQKVGRNETRNKLTPSEQVSGEKALQDGHAYQGHKSSETQRLGGFNRSERCVFSCPHLQTPQTVSEVLYSGKGLPVSSNVFRPHAGTKSLHENSVSSGCISENTKHTNSNISRRLVDNKLQLPSGLVRSRKDAQSFGSTRFYCEHKEVHTRTHSKDNLLRKCVRSKTGVSVSNCRESTEIRTGPFQSSKPEHNCQRLLTPSRDNGIMHRTYTQCQIVHASPSNSFAPLLETSISKVGNSNSSNSTPKGPFELVVQPSKYTEGQVATATISNNNSDNRCVQKWLRWPHGQTHISRSVVSRGEKTSHQSVGTRGSLPICSTLSSPGERSDNTCQMRQHNSCPVYKQTRRHKVSNPVLSGVEVVDLSNRKQHGFESSPSGRSPEHFSGSSVQNENSPIRMVPEPLSSFQDFLGMGGTNDRSICLGRQSQSSNILFLDSRPQSVCNRCSNNIVGRNVCLCLPSNLSNSESPTTHAEVQLPDNSDSPTVATSPLVHKSSADVSRKSHETTNQVRSVKPAKNKNIPSKSGCVQSVGLAALNKNFQAKGFSKQTRKLLSASWRKGTRADYCSKFKKFNSWCCEREKDPYVATLIDCADFLTHLFHEGLQYRTIAGYRSMLSAVVSPIDNIPIGQHPYIIRLLKGVFNSRPPKVKLVPEWSLPKVLKMLQCSPFEPLKKASLKHVTLKTIFLVAITTFRRCADIQALRLGEGFVQVQSRGVTFMRQGLSKQDRPDHFSSKIFVPSFESNKKLDPKRALAVYLRKTESFRRKPDGSDQPKLFLAVKEPHQPVSRQTIARWITSTIKMAYDKDIKVNAHSTRAIGPSWALFNGASMSSILSAADWSSESTFAKFYLRNVDVSVLS